MFNYELDDEHETRYPRFQAEVPLKAVPEGQTLPDPDNMEEVRAFAATIPRFKLSHNDYVYLMRPWWNMRLPYTEAQHFLVRLEPDGFTHEITDDEYYASNPPPDSALIRQIGLDLAVCPECEGTMMRKVPAFGPVTGVRVIIGTQCRCKVWQMFFRRLEHPRALGKEHHPVRMENLLNFSANFSSFQRSGRFEELVELVQKFNDRSFLLAGPAGTGKTTLMAALYSNTLKKWTIKNAWNSNPVEAVWFANATSLSKQFRDFELNQGRDDNDNEGPPVLCPDIWPDKIERAVKAGHVPAVFIDEFDKWKLTSEFQCKNFSLVIDKVHAAGGQIVLTSNLSEHELRQSILPQYGEGIIRRVAGARGNPGVPYFDANGERTYDLPPTEEGGFYVDFWRGTWVQNLTWGPSTGNNPLKSRSNAHAMGDTGQPWNEEEREDSSSKVKSPFNRQQGKPSSPAPRTAAPAPASRTASPAPKTTSPAPKTTAPSSAPKTASPAPPIEIIRRNPVVTRGKPEPKHFLFSQPDKR